METFLIYLLNASGGIALFYMVFWFFLRHETFHTANRWFLIGSLGLAILLPAIPLHYSVLVEPNSASNGLKTISDSFKNIPVFTDTAETTSSIGWKQALLLVYVTGAAIFLLRLLIQTFVLIHLMIKHRKKSLNGIRIIENEKYGLPFSFFNIIFINPKFHTQDDLPEILAHEKVHIRENHWFDLLIIELLTVIFWFNPFIWLFERSIKQNHEYLADKGVLAQGHTVARYQALLVNQLMGMQIIGITNNLNFALSTNRLKMMTKKKTPRLLGLKFMWALPVLALLLYAFAEPEYQVSNPGANTSEMQTEKLITQKTTLVKGTVYDEQGDLLPGTSIVVKGGTLGTVVDRDGTFSMGITENSDIVLSFVGKQTIVVKYSELISGTEKDGMFTRKYIMKDAVQILHNKSYTGKQLPPPPPPPPPTKSKEELFMEGAFMIVEDMPKYPGGYETMQDYIAKMQQKIAQGKGVKGKAKVAFTVDAEGKVSDIKVVEQDNDGAAKGAYIIASEMPEWTPGKQRGKAVSVKYLLPVEFK
ncbi:M56 family metallopeptidase [Maribellus sediminis]|uniref:M56 family metallopeptidase n=1 Tax=Maribellus sediminis TaxID=2696285 RepID=UPI0014304443|nr:M56 family metallopeptidase [Maribellus sediminis]